jgi:peptidoglycan/LPS O-acetylase OafA/YrhL
VVADHQPSLDVAPRGADEAGTPPDDRRFRPDVEGLRAIAILLVVAYHANVPGLPGGFVGVDVFFVISGYVITGLLLRERASTGSTSLLHFYARRCRRILPAATLVILVTVVATAVVLGQAPGAMTADAGRWAAVFLANFHFEQIGTDYFTASLPPSPLQHYWSLSVEEQFYVVYPTLFLVIGRIRGRISPRACLAGVLGIVIVLSYWLSVTQTASHPSAAYFSPFTRAWELALGALVAVAAPMLKQVPTRVAAAATWLGLAAVVVAGCTFDPNKIGYPGSYVALPVIGTAVVIAGGVVAPAAGAELFLGRRPVQWIGRRSFSWYLWHWPVLIIAAESVRTNRLGLGDNVALAVFSLGLAALTYVLVENPVRHSRLSTTQSVVGGVGVILATLLVLTAAIGVLSSSPVNYRVPPATDTQQVVSAVDAAPSIRKVPPDIDPSVNTASQDWGGHIESRQCVPGASATTTPICTLGDPAGSKLLVVYGDSHALQWLPALDAAARSARWRLVALAKPGCPAGLVTVVNPAGIGPVNGPYLACEAWHRWVIAWIRSHRPAELVVTQRSDQLEPAPGDHSRSFTAATWGEGLGAFLRAVAEPDTRTAVLGDTPLVESTPDACLRQHRDAVQACSTAARSAVSSAFNAAEQSAADRTGVSYVDTVPWFCSSTCTPIVGRYVVYLDGVHITGTYADYLRIVLGRALGLPVHASSA